MVRTPVIAETPEHGLIVAENVTDKLPRPDPAPPEPEVDWVKALLLTTLTDVQLAAFLAVPDNVYSLRNQMRQRYSWEPPK